ncbi:putative glucan endo-1,3-beta-D-glucosidase [Lupinus albus]|uniref:glucan endo-1,3-beta-D-glucosidase n=1 Tax=Lupinus albus TaxID=3870 RepID=A0A6A4R2N8_LUPAL|nr:putative glucan endo-1,3-beta-D-glucosidase [Lupinus albus]
MCHEAAQSIGVCYGRVADNLPSAEEVIGLFKANGIERMRIYDPDLPTIQALRGSNIELSVGVPNQVIQSFATNAAAATEWVQNNIQTYANDVKFRYIIVGNEIMHHDEAAQFVAPAMQNIYNALESANLESQIKVSTAIQLGLLITSYPPSSGAFGTASTAYMTPILSFLVKNEAPLLANLYTYFSYIGDPKHISLDYALFTSPGTVVKDGQYEYQNIFDASLDSLYAALEKVGAPNLEVVISESGWPSDGGIGATVDNANTYYGNLVKHVKNGTPRRPNQPLETYLFAMFDEDKKGPAETERHFGLFYPTKQPKYQILTNIVHDHVFGSSSSLTRGGMFPSFLFFLIIFIFL